MNNKHCALVRELLPQYIKNNCSEQSAETVKKHLETCPDCREYYETLKDTCVLVTELLPLYAEGFCGAESSRIVEYHLDFCADCRERYSYMKKEIVTAPAPSFPAKIRRPFKKIRGHYVLRSIIAIILIVIIAVPLTILSINEFSGKGISFSAIAARSRVDSAFSAIVSGDYAKASELMGYNSDKELENYVYTMNSLAEHNITISSYKSDYAFTFYNGYPTGEVTLYVDTTPDDKADDGSVSGTYMIKLSVVVLEKVIYITSVTEIIGPAEHYKQPQLNNYPSFVRKLFLCISSNQGGLDIKTRYDLATDADRIFSDRLLPSPATVGAWINTAFNRLSVGDIIGYMNYMGFYGEESLEKQAAVKDQLSAFSTWNTSYGGLFYSGNAVIGSVDLYLLPPMSEQPDVIYLVTVSILCWENKIYITGFSNYYVTENAKFIPLYDSLTTKVTIRMIEEYCSLLREYQNTSEEKTVEAYLAKKVLYIYSGLED